jgi:hypothetical protein
VKRAKVKKVLNFNSNSYLNLCSWKMKKSLMKMILTRMMKTRIMMRRKKIMIWNS